MPYELTKQLSRRYLCCKRVWYSLMSITHMVQKTWVRILVGCSRRYCFVRAHWTTNPSVPLSCTTISSSLWNNKYRAFRDILLKIIQAKMLPVRKATVDGRASRRFSSSCFVCSCPNNTLADCSYGPIASQCRQSKLSYTARNQVCPLFDAAAFTCSSANAKHQCHRLQRRLTELSVHKSPELSEDCNKI